MQWSAAGGGGGGRLPQDEGDPWWQSPLGPPCSFILGSYVLFCQSNDVGSRAACFWCCDERVLRCMWASAVHVARREGGSLRYHIRPEHSRDSRLCPWWWRSINWRARWLQGGHCAALCASSTPQSISAYRSLAGHLGVPSLAGVGKGVTHPPRYAHGRVARTLWRGGTSSGRTSCCGLMQMHGVQMTCGRCRALLHDHYTG